MKKPISSYTFRRLDGLDGDFHPWPPPMLNLPDGTYRVEVYKSRKKHFRKSGPPRLTDGLTRALQIYDELDPLG